MRLALIVLSIFVAISHQQYFHPRMMFGFPWMSSFSQQPVTVNDYNEEVYPGLMGLNSRNDIDQNDEFNDIQSRIKGFSGNFNGLSRYRPSPSLNDQQNARFFFNFANTANTGNNFNNYNPFFKTATFTLTSTLTLVSMVSCVPSTQVVLPPVACRRKRSENEEHEIDQQFSIAPSETISVMPTAILTPHDRSLDILSSSRDDFSDELSNSYYPNLREKRFFYGNKNLFVVSSTLTTYAFVNTTVTVTVNLLNPAPVAPAVCVPDAVVANAVGAIQCVACLPAGLIVCPLAG